MFEGKREKILNLIEIKEKPLKEFHQRYVGPGLLKKIKRLLKYREKYLKYSLSRLISASVKIKTFWGKEILPSSEIILYLLGTLSSNQEIKLNKFLIKNLPENSIFYDIGANIGFYSLLVDDIIVQKEIHAFEPVPSIFKHLKDNFSNTQKIFLNQIALFNKEGEIDFYDGLELHSGASTVDISGINPAIVSKFKKIKIKATTLDRYCFSHSLPTFLKIDVEGAEGEVIEGGMETLEKINPVIAMEVWRKPFNNKSHLKAIEILYRLGYKSYKINQDGELIFVEKLIPEKEISEEDNFDNFVFKK